MDRTEAAYLPRPNPSHRPQRAGNDGETASTAPAKPTAARKGKEKATEPTTATEQPAAQGGRAGRPKDIGGPSQKPRRKEPTAAERRQWDVVRGVEEDEDDDGDRPDYAGDFDEAARKTAEQAAAREWEKTDLEEDWEEAYAYDNASFIMSHPEPYKPRPPIGYYPDLEDYIGCGPAKAWPKIE